MVKRSRSRASSDGPPADLGPGDAQFDELVATLKATSCGYCLSPVEWVRPVDAWNADRDAIEYMLKRAGAEYADIVFTWYCTGCENFSIVGETFEEQWLDSEDDPMPCEECHALAVNPVDPAQIAVLDRARYLAAKRDHGAEALLSGTATLCDACGAIGLFPG